MTRTVRTYFIDGDNLTDVPSSYEAAKSAAAEKVISVATLKSSPKWEPLLEGVQTTLPKGWTVLGTLARTKRGIASGHNDFFLLPRNRIGELGIQPGHHRPCIGRTSDVKHYAFTVADLEEAENNGSRTRLLTFGEHLNEGEISYIKQGEQAGVNSRYLLKQRNPWFTMERRPAAPIWALVFTRAGARFIRNNAAALSLTNFHAVYPMRTDADYLDALTCVLNSEPVSVTAQAHWRRYGGGLTKFEPADLLAMPLPNVQAMPSGVLGELAALFREMDRRSRNNESIRTVQDAVTARLTTCLDSDSQEQFLEPAHRPRFDPQAAQGK